MILRWLGHAAFDLRVCGLRLCLDPHAPGALGGRFDLPAIAGPFDAIVNSHPHEDHLAWRPALGTTRVLDTDTTLHGPGGDVRLRFRAVPHDRCCGGQMGWTRMVAMEAEGRRLIHAGDIGAWTAEDAAWLAGCDALLVPVGGTYTLDGPGAAALCDATAPVRVVPMHAADPRIDLPLAPVSDFLDALAWPRRELAELVLDGDAHDGPELPGEIVLLALP